MCQQWIMTNIIKQPWIKYQIHWMLLINSEMIRYTVSGQIAKDLVK